MMKKNSRESDKKKYNYFSKFGWLVDEAKLYEVYKLFYFSSKIQIEYEDFELHFFNSKVVKDQIVWYGSSSELIQAFWLLRSLRFLPGHSKFMKLICFHFCKPDGKQIKNRSLSTLRTDDMTLIISEFVEDLKKKLIRIAA